MPLVPSSAVGQMFNCRLPSLRTRLSSLPHSAAKPRPRRSTVVRNSSDVLLKDASSGVEFHLAQQFWAGNSMRCLGCGTRVKKVFLFNAKVYSVALYVEGERCSKELGIRHRGGFFETDDDYCSALLDGAFSKALLLRLVRDVDGPTFVEALEEALAPRLRAVGKTAELDTFRGFFESRNLTEGTEVVFVWSPAGDLGALVVPAAAASYHDAKPELSLEGAALNRALFELYLGSAPVVPEARSAWVQGAKNLLDYDKVKRSTKREAGG